MVYNKNVNYLTFCFFHLLFKITIVLTQTCNFGNTNDFCSTSFECGIQKVSPNVRIVGGQQATPFSWPSMALVVFNYKFYYSYNGGTYLGTYSAFCGGTLINNRTVMTAAHCYSRQITVQNSVYNVKLNSFHPTIASMYKVYLGLNDKSGAFDSSINISPGEAKNINGFILHPNFQSNGNLLNDIAIIKLAEDVTFKDNIQPACLPPSSSYSISNGAEVWAAGWGKLTASSSSTPNNLYNVKMDLKDGSVCNSVGSQAKDWTKQICAGTPPQDTCQGDSGGPLFNKDTLNSKTKYIVIGITSYGVSCGVYPGIYTRVSYYLDWIRTQNAEFTPLYYSSNTDTYGKSNRIKSNYFILFFSLILIYFN